MRCGGGVNHRFGLDDAILIKDNHVAACGGVAAALRRAQATAGHLTPIEVEVDTLEQLAQALPFAPHVIMLDNFNLDDLRRAVAMTDERVRLEASGGVTLETVRAIAETGVNAISVGALTHSAPVLDIGLGRLAEPRGRLPRLRLARCHHRRDPAFYGSEHLGRCGFRTARIERRGRGVFQPKLQRLGEGVSGDFGHEGQGEVDARRHSSAREDVFIAHHPARIRDRAEQRQKMSPLPMAGCTPSSQQTRRAEDQRAGADEVT